MSLLETAEAWWDARSYVGSGNLRNLGYIGSSLNLIPAGSGHDPTWLPFDGTSKYAYFPGYFGNNFPSTPDSANNSVTGDIDIRARVALDTWASTFYQPILSKNNTGTGSYDIFINNDGTMQFRMSSTGSGITGNVSSSVAVPGTNGQPLWLRWTRVQATGVVTFYTALDSATEPSSWSQLGSTVVCQAGVAIFDGTSPVVLGLTENGNFSIVGGKIYRAMIRSGIGGTLKLDYDATVSVEPHNTFTASTGEVWTHNRATSSSKKLAVVDRPMLLFGTDDFLATTPAPPVAQWRAEGMTVVIACRIQTDQTSQIFGTTYGIDNGANGWFLWQAGGTFLANVTDSVNHLDVGTAISGNYGQSLVHFVRSSLNAESLVSLNALGQIGSGSNVGNPGPLTGVTNSIYALVLGANGTTGQPTAMEFLGAAIFRRILSDDEVTTALGEFLSGSLPPSSYTPPTYIAPVGGTVEYRVLFGGVLDGTIEGEIEAHDLKYSQLLIPPSSMSCWVDMDHPKSTRDNLDPGATAMYIERGGRLVWGGILWTAKADSVNRKVSLECKDFWSYFRKRRLRASRVYTNQDQLFIARDMINYAQAQPLGSLGITVGSETSGVITSDSFDYWERTEIAAIVEDLANSVPGFDFNVEVAWDSTSTIPLRTLRFWAPRRGRRIDGLVFNHNIQGISNFESDVDATTIANIVDAIGSGDGKAMLTATGVDSSNLGRYPLFEDILSLKDEKSQSHLQAAANWSVMWKSLPAEVPSITKDPQIWPDMGSFEPGDEGLVVARSGNWLNLYGYYHILGWEVTREDSGKEQMRIDLTEAR